MVCGVLMVVRNIDFILSREEFLEGFELRSGVN